jgi:hypothetical protein
MSKVLFVLVLISLAFSRPVLAQTQPIEVGDAVRVNTGGKNLNLRSQPSTSSAVIASLPNGTLLEVIGGPESGSGLQWWQVKGAAGTGWAAAQFLEQAGEAVEGSPSMEPTAEASPGVDWRGNLSCSPFGEQFMGVEHCTGIEKDKDGQAIPGAVVDVLVIDLAVQGVSFQYILPEGYSDLEGTQDDQGKALHECRDPNVPRWGGLEGGCYASLNNKGIYSTIDMETAVARAQEVAKQEGLSNPLAGLIDADYAAGNKTHGPEGLMVVRGVRLDGAAHCDDDFNAALRPWLGLGKGFDPALERLRVEINRLERDSSEVPGWIDTAIGGGPWLISEGEIVPNSENCQGVKTLTQLEAVTNCNYEDVIGIKNKKKQSTESYAGGSCRTTAHTAAGFTRDGRWLFLVVTSSEKNPLAIAQFMKDQLGVWQAMKFDGGGSAKLFFNGAPPAFVMPYPDKPRERTLSNYLAVYSPPGDGIKLPLLAEPKQRVYYQVINTGETAEVKLEFTNTGSLSWVSEDGVELREEPWSMLSPVVDSQPLEGPVAPGETASWTWRMNTSGVLVQRFQMYQKKEPFGPEAAVIIVVLPKGWEDKRQEIEGEIQKMIDEWDQKKDAAIDQLVQEIVKYAEREVTNFIRSIFEDICSPAALLIATAFIAARPGRYRLRRAGKMLFNRLGSRFSRR